MSMTLHIFRSYDLFVNGGTIYEKGVDVDPSIGRRGKFLKYSPFAVYCGCGWNVQLSSTSMLKSEVSRTCKTELFGYRHSSDSVWYMFGYICGFIIPSHLLMKRTIGKDFRNEKTLEKFTGLNKPAVRK